MNADNAVVYLLILLVAFAAAPDIMCVVDSHPQREDEEIRRIG